MSICMTVKYVFVAFFFLMLSVTAHAVNGRTTYQAKIVKPDGYPLEASSVFFRFTVLDPTGSCVLFVEDYPPANMTGSGGLISFALGSGSRTYPASGTMTFAKVFDNAEPIFTCQTPAVYNPVSTDNRKIVMQFNDGNGWQTLPAMAINAVPYAMYAGKSDDSKTLNNKLDTAFVEYSTLSSLNCQSNEAIKFNGVSFGCIAISSATVVTSGTVITALGYTPADGASVTAVSSDIFSVSSTVSSLAGSVSSLQSSTAASFAAITSSQWNNVASGISYLSGNVGVGTSAPTSMLHVESNSNPPALFVRNNSANNSTMTAAAIKAKTTGAIFDGYGVGLSFRIEGSGVSETTYGSIGYVRDGADNSSKINFNNIDAGVGKTSMVIASSGNVGIGTTTPVTKLEVSGGVRISMESATCAVSYAGTLRYNSGSVEFCNGTTWSAFGVSGAGLQALNGSTSGTQTFANGTAGNSPAFVTANGVHTLNIPLASTAAVTAGLISNSDYQNFNNKITSSAASISQVLGYTPASASALSNYLVRANNLSDLGSSATARANLGVGYIGTLAAVDLGSSDVSGTLAIARTPSYTGDVTKAAASNTLVLSNSGVTAGTYTKVTVDAKGRVTSSSSLASSDVTTALGYTPAASGSFTSSQWNTNGTSINYMLGSVGIGTSTPTTTLDVRGTMNVYQSTTEGLPTWNAAEYFRFVGNGNSGYHTDISVVGGTGGEAGIVFGDKDNSKMGGVRYMNSSERLELLANGATQVTITASGNVGVGTTSPAAKLHISNLNTGSEALRINSASSNVRLTVTNKSDGTGYDFNIAQDSDGAANKNLTFSAGGSEKLRLSPTGYIGIGTSSPAYALDVSAASTVQIYAKGTGTNAGGIMVDNATGGYQSAIFFRDAGTTKWQLGKQTDNTFFIYDAANSRSPVKTNSSGDLLLQPTAGNVGLGVANPSAKLHLASGTTTNASLKITSGTLLTTAQDGAIEYDGTNLYYTDSTNTRRALASTGGGSGQTFSGTNTFTGVVNVSNNTASTNSSTGAFVVSGGAGIGGALNVAGAVSFGSTLNVTGQVSGSSRVLATGFRANQGVPDSNDSSTNGYAFGADGDTGLFSPGSGAANGVLAFYSNNSEKMRIMASGNVGIGTTSPGHALHIANTVANGEVALKVENLSATSGSALLRAKNQNRNWAIGVRGDTSDILSFQDDTAGAIRMAINSSGNVGIGTTSPGYKLTVPAGISVGDAAAGSSEASLTPLIHSYLGTSGDVGAGSTIYILLAYNQSAGSGINTSGFDGEIYVYRGSAGSWNNATKYDVALKTAYNGPGLYRFNTSGPMAGAQIVTLTYGGTSYVALQAPAASAQDVYISGRFWSFKPIMLDSVNHAGLVTAVSTLSYPYMATSVGANGSAANIGIGTGSPNTKFVVYNGTTFNPASNVSAAVTLQGNYGGGLVFSDTKYIGLWSSNAGQTLNFATNSTNAGFGTAQMVIDNGNVGIGAAVPSRKLHVASTGSAEFVLEQTDAKADYKKWNFVVDAGNGTTASNFYIRQLNDALGGGNVPFSINGTSGYVSIGNGLTFAAAVGDPAPTITTRTVPAGQGAANEKTELILFHSNDYANGSGADQITLRAPGLSFQTYENATVANINDNNGYNERMYIAPNGFVGIGTAAPTALLHVNGSILTNAITGGQLNGAGNFHLDAWSSGADRSVYLNWNSGTGGAKIGNGSQNWGPISASAFNTSSDRRLKENIRPIPYALDKVLQLDAVTFTWKDETRHKQEGERLGLIAQNVEKIFPQAVRIDRGENTLPGGTKLVTYPDLVAPLIAAIKELYHKWVDDSKQLHETVEQQAREIASVKEENKQLKVENEKTKRQNDEIKAYLCSKDPAAPICK